MICNTVYFKETYIGLVIIQKILEFLLKSITSKVDVTGFSVASTKEFLLFTGTIYRVTQQL